MIFTYQDFEKADDIAKFVESAIQQYKRSDTYQTAILADEYDAQRNPTVTSVIQTFYNAKGKEVKDFTASNHRIASNLFSRLNTQRCMYSLGNGVSFLDPDEAKRGEKDTTKESLGKHFDHVIKEAAYHALIHGVSYLLQDIDNVYEFQATEFVPLDDETDGTLRAGIRFWQIDKSRPLNATLYETDGFTKYSTESGKFSEVQPKRAYSVTYQYTEADEGDMVTMGEENYSSLPIVRMYGSRLKQSTLVGLREAIDAYDLIQSGFANDLTDCAQIYWLVENSGGLDEQDLAKFLDRLKLNHIANVDTSAGGKVQPYTQNIPYQERLAFLADIKARMYEDFGALDVHTVAAGATNDHIDAAYQPMEENAADFEHWVSEAIVQLLALRGIDDTPIFNRNRISNQLEQVQMVVQEANWLDLATILRKLPNLTPDERQSVLEEAEKAERERMNMMGAMGMEQQEGVQEEAL